MLDESPKWLLATGKYEEAKAVILKIIRKNHLDKNIDVDAILEKSRESLLLVSSNNVHESL